MSSGMVGFRLNQQLTAVLTTLPGSPHTVVKALFLLQLCQDRAELGCDPQLLVPDVRAVLRYLLPAQLRAALEAWLKAAGGTPPPALVGAVNRPMHGAVVREHAVRDDRATGLSSAPETAVRDEASMMNAMHDVLDEGEEF